MLSVSVDGGNKIGVVHRWSDGLTTSNDVVMIYNMVDIVVPVFELTSMPYDGVWTVRFNGDDKQYSELYGDSCLASTQTVTVTGGTARVCVPSMSTLVLTRAS